MQVGDLYVSNEYDLPQREAYCHAEMARYRKRRGLESVSVKYLGVLRVSFLSIRSNKVENWATNAYVRMVVGTWATMKP